MVDRSRVPGAVCAVTRVLLAVVIPATIVVAAGGAASANDADHVVTIVNRCKQQIWIGEFGSPALEPHEWALAPTCTKRTEKRVCGPTGTCDGGACTCTSHEDCKFGTSGTVHAKCDLSSGKCVRRLKLKMPPGWQGRLWPRTGCSGDATTFTCETGQCGPASGGNIDCNVQKATGNLATLFEIAAAGLGGADSYDVSTVSGYNVPIALRVGRPDDAPIWQANTRFTAGAQIVERIGKNTFEFINTGRTAQSGPTKPDFSSTWGPPGVTDGKNGVEWTNNGPSCEASGCTRRGIDGASCPSVLQVQGASGTRVACDAPGNACGGALSCTTDEQSYFQCVNNGGQTDMFGNMIPLMSPNGASPVCFVNDSGASDCQAGTTCTAVTAWSADGTVGVCTPVIQNGGCEPGDEGQPCPAINYPYLGYTCQTVTTPEGSAQVCAPPLTSGMGALWWNADNFVPSPLPPPAPPCTTDTDCGAPNKCMAGGPVNGGLKACEDGDPVCGCYAPVTCTSSDTCTNGTVCENSAGAACGASETCYCQSQAIYGGVCGPINPGWRQAAGIVADGGASWPQGFKDGCPLSYSYQYDDPSSNWDCTNTATGLNSYRLILCGAAAK